MGNGGGDITATASIIGEWETFRVLPLDNFTNSQVAPVRIKSRVGYGAGATDIFLTKLHEHDPSVYVDVADNQNPDRQKWRLIFTSGNASTGGNCVIVHAPTGQLLSVPMDFRTAVLTTTFDRSSLFNVVVDGDDPYRVLRPIRNFDMNLMVPWSDNGGSMISVDAIDKVPRVVRLWSWAHRANNELWRW
jgi:hypothetical protein